MSRIVGVAIAVLGVALCGGYKDIFVPPPIEQPATHEAQRLVTPLPVQELEPAEPVQPAEPAQPEVVEELMISVPGATVPKDDLENAVRAQLEQRYRMPILDAPVEIDPHMAFVPDAGVEYSMPVILPEGGVLLKSTPEDIYPRMSVPQIREQEKIKTPDPEPEQK